MAEPSRKASLGIIFLVVFIDLIGFGMVLPLLPIYADRFSLEHSGLTIGLLMASFSAMQFLFAPMWGRISDRIGRRPVLLVGLAGSVIFYGLFAVASIYESLALLFVSRIGAGIAGATISTAHAYIADITGLESRTKGMALIGAAFGMGFTFGPLFAWLAIPEEGAGLGPGPGYAASGLSALAFVLAWFLLQESLKPGVASTHRRRWLDTVSLAEAWRTPSVGLLLITSFICVFAFANFESTLSLTLGEHFDYKLQQICLVFAFVGITLMIVQGGIVRRLAGRVSDVWLAASGAVIEIFGFYLLLEAGDRVSLKFLLVALAIIVTGFAFLTPSLNSLISRRSDPAKQGSILGVAQSISSLARIAGPMVGIPLFKESAGRPLVLGIGAMLVGLIIVLIANRRGHDFAVANPSSAASEPANRLPD